MAPARDADIPRASSAAASEQQQPSSTPAREWEMSSDLHVVVRGLGPPLEAG